MKRKHRLGIISDIHSDAKSLQSALDLLVSKGVEKVLCAGDVVECDDDGEAVVESIQESLVGCVLGNHDEAALSRSQWLQSHPDMLQELRKTGLLLGTPLSSNSIEYFKTLKKASLYIRHGQRILLTHFGIDAKDEMRLAENFLNFCHKLRVKVDADIVIFGHTHSPKAICHEGVYFFNPCAVCRRKQKDSHTCAVLTLPACSFEVYDIRTGDLELSFPL